MEVAFMLEAILGWLPSKASHLAQQQQAGSKHDTFVELVLPRKGAQAKAHSDYSFAHSRFGKGQGQQGHVGLHLHGCS